MSTLLHSSVPGNIRYSPTSSTALACSKRLPICLGAWRTLVCCAYHAGDHINGIDTRQGETSPVFRRGCTCSLSTAWTITQFGVRVCAVRVITPTMLNPPVPSRPPSKWRTVSVVPGVCTKHGRAPTVLKKHIAHIGLRIACVLWPPGAGPRQKGKTMQKHGPPQAPGAAGGAHLSTPCDPGQPKVSGSTHRVVSNRDHSFPKWIHSPSDVGTTKVPIHFTQDDHHSRDVEHGHPPPHKVFTTITEGETITRCPHWFPDSCSYRRRTTKKGVVELSHLFSDPSPNGAQLEPWIRS